MIDKVRGLMTVESVLVTPYNKTVKLRAQYSDSPEDNTYAEATPSATIEMSVTHKAVADFFEPGKRFYVDFTRAD